MPGPVIGLVLLVFTLAVLPPARTAISPTVTVLLRHLSLLFVPAAVGIVQQLPRLRTEGVAIGAAVLVSTWMAIAVTALTFRAVARALDVDSEG